LRDLRAGGERTQLEHVLPDYVAALSRVAASEYAPTSDSGGRSVLVARESATFPNGAAMHVISWHAAGDAAGGDPRRTSTLDLLAHVTEPDGDDAAAPDEESKARPRSGGGMERVGEEEEDHGGPDAHRGDRSERSGKSSTRSVASIFRRLVLDRHAEAPVPLRRLRALGLGIALVIAAAAIALNAVASADLSAVMSATELVWSGADRCARAAPSVRRLRGILLLMCLF
jgi:hypothetical protein